MAFDREVQLVFYVARVASAVAPRPSRPRGTHFSRKCVGSRYLYVLRHIQMTLTHTEGGCSRGVRAMRGRVAGDVRACGRTKAGCGPAPMRKPRTPPLTDLCALASFVGVAPRTNDANPHTRRMRAVLGFSRRRSPRRPPHSTHPAAPGGARSSSPLFAASHTIAPHRGAHFLRKCAGSRYLYVLCHTQMTRTYTRGGCSRGLSEMRRVHGVPAGGSWLNSIGVVTGQLGRRRVLPN